MRNKGIILHPIFVISLILLLLNDFYFKYQFSNLLTGKISDFTGLIVFPAFIAFVFPKSKTWVSIITGILFVIWKTPLVSQPIAIFNEYSIFEIQRIVDYSDYWALIVLPIAHKLINSKAKVAYEDSYLSKTLNGGVVAISLFAICATSVPRPAEIPKGTIYIGKKYTIKKSKEETIDLIKSLGYNIDYYENNDYDSIDFKKYYLRKEPYYQTDNIVIFDDNANPLDTILNIKYTLYEFKKNKTEIEIINVTLSEKGTIQKWQTLKHLQRQYKKILKETIIDKMQH